MAPIPSEIATFLKETKACDVQTNHKEVIEIGADQTPIQAAQHLWKNKVIGAPVWDDQRKKYVGFFDMRDMLSTVIASHKEETGTTEDTNKNKNIAQTKWFMKDFSPPSVAAASPNSVTVSYLAARNPFVFLPEDATLEEVCRVCSSRHCHRVPLVDKTTGRCTGILSQSAIVKFLVDHLLVGSMGKKSELKEFFDKDLEQSSFPYKKEVMTAPDTATACEVFEIMDRHRLSGIAVVDASDGTGTLVANTSASDIKLAVAVDEGILADLGLNILTYLSAVRQEDPTKEAKYPSSHVKESSTLGHAVRLLAKTGYHRVFVTDAELKPVGVISVTDIVKFLTEQ